MSFKKLINKKTGKILISLIMTLSVLSCLAVPLAFADFTGIGTDGDDELVGEVFDLADYTDGFFYTDPGGDDSLTNVVFKNSGVIMKTLVKDVGSYSVIGTLTISNIAVICHDMKLSESGVLSLDRLQNGSSVRLTEIGGSLPRVIATGARYEDLRQEKIYTTAENVELRYVNSTIVAYPTDEPDNIFVFFNGNRATTAPVPAQIEVIAGESVGTLPYPPQRTGYYFNGWNTKMDGSGSVFNWDTVVESSVTVYAQWVLQAEPVFSQHPRDLNLTEGEQAVFSVKVTGFPEPVLRWEKENQFGVWETISVNNSALVIENVSASDEGLYKCVAFNDAAPEGVESFAAKLTVESAAEAPSLSCSVAEIDFGDVYLTNEAVFTLDVAGLNLVSDISFNITHSSTPLRINGTASWNVLTGGRMNIYYKPIVAGPFSFDLTISSGSTVLHIAVKGNGIAEDSPLLNVSPTVIDFGEIVVDTISYPRTVNVSHKNLPGSPIITYSGLSDLGNPFTLATAPGWSYSAGGGLLIAFAPKNEGYAQEELIIKAGGLTKTVILRGTGIAKPAAPKLTAAYSGTTLNFGNVYTVASANSKIEVTVAGTALASNISATLFGSDSGQFSVVKKSGWSDTKGGVLEVIFNPTSAGGKAAELSITAVGFGIEPKKILLTGTGVPAFSPEFTVHPQNQTKAEGENVTFSALAAGTPNPDYQWQCSDDNGVSWNDLAGKISSNLSLTNVDRTMDGYKYRCVASNLASPSGVVSQTATLTVSYPRITVNPAAVNFGNVSVGGDKDLLLAVTGAWLTGDISYSKSGADAQVFSVTQPGSWSASSGGQLVIHFNPTEAKTYSVLLLIKGGDADDVTVELTGTGIIIPPSFIVQPKDRTVNAGGSAEFSVELASGTASYTLKWQKRADSSASWTDISGQTGNKLTLSGVAAGDNETQYRCVAVYSEGEVASSTATLKVEIDHSVTDTPDKITATGKTAVFKINGEVEKVTGLKIDAKAATLDGKGSSSVKVKLDSKEIGALTKGSVVLTLNADFVDSLSNGVHTFDMEFDDGGIARGSFTIARASSGTGNGSGNGNGTGTGTGAGAYSPYTGDRTGFGFWMLLAAGSFIGLTLICVLAGKSRKTKPALRT